MHARIEQAAVLAHRLGLLVRRVVGEGVVAGVVVEAVAAHVEAQIGNGVGVQDAGVGRGEVDGLDLGALVRLAHGGALWREHAQILVVIRCLEPGMGILRVEVNRILRAQI